MLKTYNSKHDVNGNRKNLVVNEATKQFFYAGGHTFSMGEEENGLGINLVRRLHNGLLMEGYESVSAEQAHTWLYIPKRCTLIEAEAQKVISQSQFDNLIFHDRHIKIWLSRMTIEDGMKYDNQITVEALVDGAWKTIDQYEAK